MRSSSVVQRDDAEVAPAQLGNRCPETPPIVFLNRDAQRQTHAIARLETAFAALADSVETWTEHDLDACGMPHPILGVLSVREMLLFELYHNTHHERGISRIVAEA